MSPRDGVRPERSIEDLLAYARTMERAAAERYAQLAEIMAAHNNRELSELFRRMSEIEWLHVYGVGELSRELAVSDEAVRPSAGDRLRGPEIPEVGDMHYMHSPHHALRLAYQYEQSALRFYLRLAESAEEAGLRSAARHLAAEEESHMRELERWLLRYPEPGPGWDHDPDPPNPVD